jgi:hypothetical protein
MNTNRRTGAQDLLRLIVLFLAVLMFLFTGTALAGGTWFKGALGYSGMAMDDVNNSEFYFFEYSEGFDLDDVSGGMSLSLHLGYDMDPRFGFGFSWDMQKGGTSGTDESVTGDLDLDANFFMTHLYWTPLRSDRLAFGLAGGLGPFFADGKVKLTEGSVNYGQSDMSGSSWASEVMGTVDYRLSRLSALQLTLGWRWAKMDEFKIDSAPVLMEDGSNMSLDYTGYIVKLGWKAWFGWEGDSGHPDIN